MTVARHAPASVAPGRAPVGLVLRAGAPNFTALDRPPYPHQQIPGSSRHNPGHVSSLNSWKTPPHVRRTQVTTRHWVNDYDPICEAETLVGDRTRKCHRYATVNTDDHGWLCTDHAEEHGIEVPE